MLVFVQKLLNRMELIVCSHALLLNLFYVYFCTLFPQTKTSIALLYDDGSENAYDIRLKLTKEVLTIQKQDVICISGSDCSANVSASVFMCFPTLYYISQ